MYKQLLRRLGIQGEPRVCSAEEVAQLLLLTAEKQVPKVNEICFYMLDRPMDLARAYHEFKQASPNGNGIFTPFNTDQREVWQSVVSELKRIGITVTECPLISPQTQMFSRNNLKEGVYRLVLHSYDEIGKESFFYEDNFGTGGYIFNFTQRLAGITQHYQFVGIKIQLTLPKHTMLHEFGHILGLNHMPPNLAYQYPDCMPSDSNTGEQALKLSSKQKCQVPWDECSQGSIMYCKPHSSCPDISRLPPGDKLAFQAQHNKMLTNAGGVASHQCPSDIQSSSGANPQFYYTPPAPQFPLAPIMQAGFWLASKFRWYERFTDVQPIQFSDPLSAKLHKDRMREASVEADLKSKGTSLEESLLYLFGKKYIQGTENQRREIKEFLIQVLSGDVNSGIRNNFFQFANTVNAHLRSKQLYKLLQTTYEARWMQGCGIY